MFLKIIKRINGELESFAARLDKTYKISSLSPLILSAVKDFVLREGKRIRPALFCIGYLGYAKKPCPGLYKSALSLELLHDFMLVHDDIIDKSPTRRGKPSMHALFDRKIKGYKNRKFDGKDLAIVAGDIIYAMALDLFLSVKESPQRKESALKRFNSAVLYTGCGEFIELIIGARPIEKITKLDIYKVYDYKTANYTFASPLAMGAELAGAKKNEVLKLLKFAMLLGRAFQIKDDIIGSFGEPEETGKSNLTDILEAKKTILIWHAYRYGSKRQKKSIKDIFSKKNPVHKDVDEIRGILKEAKSRDFAEKETELLIRSALCLLKSIKMNEETKLALKELLKKVFSI